jgi:hypothetical protein
MEKASERCLIMKVKNVVKAYIAEAIGQWRTVRGATKGAL